MSRTTPQPSSSCFLRPVPAPDRHASRRRTVTGALMVTAALLLTGCSVPGLPGATGAPDSMVRAASLEGPGTPPGDETAVVPGSSESADAVVEEPAAPVWTPVAADLDAGSVTHRVSAASRTLVLDYWTEADVSRLTPESTPIIRVNAHIEGEDDGAAITVTRFTAQIQALGAELADDTGSFVVSPPYAYTSAVALPANPTAHSTEVLITFDLLTETAPGSGVFARQTVLDTVSLGYALPPSDVE